MKGLAAFIMTFRRNEALTATIHKLLQQSVAPENILIVDNDPEEGARQVYDAHKQLPLAYHPMGYNAGPAGAAKAGLQILVDEGYHRIAWIDDDDPPFFDDTIEVLLKIMTTGKNIGCVGSVGQYFDIHKALMKRVPDAELESEGILYVDNIAGNMTKIINADVIRESNIFPDESLFFGFEELDFDLHLKRKGFSIACDRQLYKRHRVYHNRQGLRKSFGGKKNERGLAREYYSTRNMFIILQKQRSYRGMMRFFLRLLLKAITGFRFGLGYGLKNSRVLLSGVFDFISGKRGQRNFIFEKTKAVKINTGSNSSFAV